MLNSRLNVLDKSKRRVLAEQLLPGGKKLSPLVYRFLGNPRDVASWFEGGVHLAGRHHLSGLIYLKQTVHLKLIFYNLIYECYRNIKSHAIGTLNNAM